MSDIETKTAAAPIDEAAPLDAAKGAEVMEKFEKESRTRNFDKPWLKKVIYFLCLAFTLYHLAYASGIRLLQMDSVSLSSRPAWVLACCFTALPSPMVPKTPWGETLSALFVLSD